MSLESVHKNIRPARVTKYFASCQSLAHYEIGISRGRLTTCCHQTTDIGERPRRKQRNAPSQLTCVLVLCARECTYSLLKFVLALRASKCRRAYKECDVEQQLYKGI